MGYATLVIVGIVLGTRTSFVSVRTDPQRARLVRDVLPDVLASILAQLR